MNHFCAALACSILVFSCSDPEPTPPVAAEKKFSAEQLQEDFKVFRITLEEAHPGLYNFAGKDSMDRAFDRAFAALDHEMTKDEFYRVLSPVVNRIYDEHTSLDFSYRYGDLEKFMPVKLRWVDGIPYIVKNLLDNPAVVLGSHVTSINGKDPNVIYREMISVYRNGTQDETLEYDVYSLHFDYLYASFYEQPDSFHIAAVNPVTKKEYMIHSPAVSVKDTVHFLPVYLMAEEYSRKDTAYRFSIERGNDLARMTISDLAALDDGFFETLRNDLKRIGEEQIGNLVIDLRYNFGGDPRFGAALLSYISEKPFHIFDTISFALEKTPTYASHIGFDAESRQWGPFIETMKAVKNVPAPGNYYASFRDTLFRPQPASFKGKTFLLVNSDMRSAAVVTASLFDYYSNATIVGSPLPGPYNCGNALETAFLALPNTGIGLNLPLFHYSYAIPDNLYPPGKGITPDILISPSIQDILGNRDAAMDTVRALIRAESGE